MTAATIIVFCLFAVLADPTPAMARTWRCEHCGNRVSADNMPQPGTNCRGNPFGNNHSWQTEDNSRSHRWVCEYCGQGVSANSTPGAQGCQKNPFGKGMHKWRER